MSFFEKKTIFSDFTIVVVKCKYIKKLIKNIFSKEKLF